MAASAGEHHDRLVARPRGRQGQVRRVSRADRGLPRAGRRRLGQHSGRAQGGSEDGREVAEPVHDGSTTCSRTGTRSRARWARACAPTPTTSRCRASSPPSTATSISRSSPRELVPTAPDVETLRELYSRLELRSLLKQLSGGEPATHLRRNCPPRGRTPRPRRGEGLSPYRRAAEAAAHPPAGSRPPRVRGDPRRGGVRALDAAARSRRSWSPSTPRRPRSTTCRRRSSASRSAWSPAARPTCRSRTPAPARRISSTAARCSRD